MIVICQFLLSLWGAVPMPPCWVFNTTREWTSCRHKILGFSSAYYFVSNLVEKGGMDLIENRRNSLTILSQRPQSSVHAFLGPVKETLAMYFGDVQASIEQYEERRFLWLRPISVSAVTFLVQYHDEVMIRESEGSFTTEIGEMGRIDVASFETLKCR